MLLEFRISIHAAREGGDPIILFHFNVNNISIHAAREGGDWFAPCYISTQYISIHAAREGGDLTRLMIMCDIYSAFQSTPPVKAATQIKQHMFGKTEISIHAAREGGDVRKQNNKTY